MKTSKSRLLTTKRGIFHIVLQWFRSLRHPHGNIKKYTPDNKNAIFQMVFQWIRSLHTPHKNKKIKPLTAKMSFRTCFCNTSQANLHRDETESSLKKAASPKHPCAGLCGACAATFFGTTFYRLNIVCDG